MYDTVTKIATNNGIIKQEEYDSKSKIEHIVKLAMNIQNTLIVQNTQKQLNIKGLLSSIKKDIESSFGSSLSSEIDGVLNSMSSYLE